MNGVTVIEDTQPEVKTPYSKTITCPYHVTKGKRVEADSCPIRKSKYTDIEDVMGVSTYANDTQSEVYNMNHKRRGVAIIFNHIRFRRKVIREGAEKDSEHLAKTLERLGFDVRIFIDPTLKTISSVLEKTADEDHSDADCLLVAAMSIGGSGFLRSAENMYPVDILWNAFTDHRCPTLAGKPKLFFIQACRRHQLDSGMHMIHSSGAVDSLTIPCHSDIMVAYANTEYHWSWQDVETGSTFVQLLCLELWENFWTQDVVRIVTSVVRRLTSQYRSDVTDHLEMYGNKSTPYIVSTLRRLVYFTKKESTNLD